MISGLLYACSLSCFFSCGAGLGCLNRAAGHVRTEVSKKMHIRKAPRFIFVEDDGAAYAAHINELLRTLNVNGDAEETSQPEETEE